MPRVAIHNIPRLATYKEALDHYNSIKPWPNEREKRPIDLDDRRRKHKAILKDATAVYCRLYSTDVVTYHIDNSIEITTHPTVSTKAFVNELLPEGLMLEPTVYDAHVSAVMYSERVGAYVKHVIPFGRSSLRFQRIPSTVSADGNRMIPTHYTLHPESGPVGSITKYTINREVAKKVLEGTPYAAFAEYVRARNVMEKLPNVRRPRWQKPRSNVRMRRADVIAFVKSDVEDWGKLYEHLRDAGVNVLAFVREMFYRGVPGIVDEEEVSMLVGQDYASFVGASRQVEKLKYAHEWA